MIVVCAHCQAENRLGARFCKNCSAQLPISIPLSASQNTIAGSGEIPTKPRGKVTNQMETRKLSTKTRTGTKPITARQQFIRRPVGAIFGDQFLFRSFLEDVSGKLYYSVTQLNIGEDTQIHVCPNRDCGAIFPPRNEPTLKFCTDCGTPLQNGEVDLCLKETSSPAAENLLRLASKGLSHGTVRAPLASFSEMLGHEVRYCLVSPLIEHKKNGWRPDSNDQAIILKTAIALGRGLDYLHDNGVHFNGQISPVNIRWIDNKGVWADFDNCEHHPEGYVKDRGKDTRALARMVFFWLTGLREYTPGANFSPQLRKIFDKVLISGEVHDAGEFASQIERILSALCPPPEICLLSGRRSDVGMARDLNEDSLVSFEWEQTKQSITQMIGVYVIADGMGGHSSGEIASGQIIDTVVHATAGNLLQSSTLGVVSDPANWLRSTVETANLNVYNLRSTAGTDMGSTLVAAILIGNHAFITHIGDSRAYLVNKKEIRQLTEDHSLVQRLVASHQITREEARHHPQRNVIYRTIGDKPTIDVDIIELELAMGDYLFLCSDGLSGMLEDHQIQEIITKFVPPQIACDELVKAANIAGGLDNLSVIVVEICEKKIATS